ncbi:nucleolar protein [Paramarasmius palmivorus]|uniref:Nucleolar protein n=1 Tax=Paramarasmius palmivorus TaxID=297713 RepID=A0AAW0EGD1_9AGAR
MAPVKPQKSSKRKLAEDQSPSETATRSKKAKSTKSKKLPSPDPQSSQSEPEKVDEEEEQEEEEDEIPLHGLTSDEDSSDDDMEEPEGIDIGKLPTIAKDDATVKRKLEKAKRQPTENRGVIYLGRLPHGFYEDQLKAYFSQFGDVTRLRVSRNKKTGASKHYAFLEFESSSVAQIVAETMDNYLLMGHILRCKVIPKDEVHPELWVGANRKWRVPRTEEEQAKANRRLIKRQKQKQQKLEAAGIKYSYDAVAYVSALLPNTTPFYPVDDYEQKKPVVATS